MGGELLGLLLSTGTAAMLWAAVQSWRALRMGARADEKDQLDLAEESRREAVSERDVAINAFSYWRTRAGFLEYLLASKGIPLPEFPDPPQSKLLVDPTPNAGDIPKGMPIMPEIPTLKEGE